MTELFMRRIGSGPPLLLVHGGIEHGDQTFPKQMALAERWTLLVPDRVGYGGSAALGDGEDFERDAALLAPVLEPGTHVLGHSSGAIAADRKSTRLNSRHANISYAVFCLKKKNK